MPFRAAHRPLPLLVFFFLTIFFPGKALASDFFALGCDIFNSEGKVVRSFANETCAFFSDGKIAMSDGRFLRLYSPEMKKLWELRRHCHHQISLSTDETEILAICSRVRPGPKGKIRYDNAVAIDLKGKILKELSLADPKGKFLTPFNWDTEKLPGVKFEETHGNSIAQIPENASSLAAFRAGNYIVNLILRGPVVIDSSFRKTLWEAPSSAISKMIHDAQVLANGNILLFSNLNKSAQGIHSSIDEFDPKAQKTAWSYVGAPPSSFYFDKCGGQAELPNGNIVFFNSENELAYVVEINRKGEILRKIRLSEQAYMHCQPIRYLTENGFLANNSSF